jgi:hypothetical protein
MAAGQGGQHLPAGRISDRRERIHDESVTVQLRFREVISRRIGAGMRHDQSAATQLC